MTERRKLRVGVVFGGRSGEHDVSLRSARAIMGALDPRFYDVVPLGITRSGHWLVGGNPLRQLEATSQLARLEGRAVPVGEDRSQPGDDAELVPVSSPPALVFGAEGSRLDVIFPAIHGPNGEDGTLQGLLELAGVPYVGAGVLASAVAMDKPTAKALFAQAGIPQVKYLVVQRTEWREQPAQVAVRVEVELGFPCFVKPANLGSSVGISKVRNADELEAALDLAASYDRKIVVEEGIAGRELEVSVMGNDRPVASAVSEIHPKHEFYDYEAKYVDGSTAFTVPADIPSATADELRALALRAYRAIDCAGMARVDFFLETVSGRLLLNEINTIPGFTAISQYPKMWEASGLPFDQLVRRLIELALERHAEKSHLL